MRGKNIGEMEVPGDLDAGITTDLHDEVARTLVERLEREVIAAWRADYEWLNVLYRPEPNLVLPVKYLPSRGAEPYNPDGLITESYRVGELTWDVVKAHRERRE